MIRFYLFLLLIATCAVPGEALAAAKATPLPVPGEPALTADDAALLRALQPPPPGTVSYINKSVPPLSSKEKAALQQAREFAERPTKSYLVANGKVTYIHGQSIPTVIGAPFQVCDVELQAGEQINEIIVGDSARWMVETGTVGDTAHLLIKPVDGGLETSLVVTTTKRIYHMRLVSQARGHMPYVGFLYQDDMRQIAAAHKAEEAREKTWNTGKDGDGNAVDLSGLNFNYSIQGKASWKPVQVYDDTRQLFIKLPENAYASSEIPVLLIRNDSGQDGLANYRVSGKTIIVDGLFPQVVLILGVGSDQEKVEIRREGV